MRTVTLSASQVAALGTDEKALSLVTDLINLAIDESAPAANRYQAAMAACELIGANQFVILEQPALTSERRATNLTAFTALGIK